ncbi:MAG: FG-GAP-like repeat-containing protein [Candidatus Omnitrophota bacterium]
MIYIALVISVSLSAHGGQIHTNLSNLGAVHITHSSSYRLQLGYAVSGAGDFDGDGYLDIAIGAPYFHSGELGDVFDSGAIFIVSGQDIDNVHNEIDLAAPSLQIAAIIGQSESRIGKVFAKLGDVNADGVDDLAIGSEDHRAGYILYGKREFVSKIFLDNLNDGGVEILNTGVTVSSAGDINRDGFHDVAFGNPYSEKVSLNGKDYHVGRVTVILGAPLLPDLLNALIPGSSHFSLRGEADALTGSSLAGNIDMNNDGASDLFIVAARGGKDFKGEGFLILGKDDIAGDNAPSYSFLIRQACREVRSAQDVNNDGYSDILIEDENSSWFLLLGGEYKGETTLSNLSGQEGTRFYGAEAVFGVGDLNGDGFDDIAAAQPNASIDGKVLAGRAVFLFGCPEWPQIVDIDKICNGEFTPLDYVIVDGDEAFGLFGSSIAAIGDIQGDGFDDVVIGAPSEKLSFESLPERPGDAYILQGDKFFMCLQTNRSVFRNRKNVFSQVKNLHP